MKYSCHAKLLMLAALPPASLMPNVMPELQRSLSATESCTCNQGCVVMVHVNCYNAKDVHVEVQITVARLFLGPFLAAQRHNLAVMSCNCFSYRLSRCPEQSASPVALLMRTASPALRRTGDSVHAQLHSLLSMDSCTCYSLFTELYLPHSE